MERSHTVHVSFVVQCVSAQVVQRGYLVDLCAVRLAGFQCFELSKEHLKGLLGHLLVLVLLLPRKQHSKQR